MVTLLPNATMNEISKLPKKRYESMRINLKANKRYAWT